MVTLSRLSGLQISLTDEQHEREWSSKKEDVYLRECRLLRPDIGSPKYTAINSLVGLIVHRFIELSVGRLPCSPVLNCHSSFVVQSTFCPPRSLTETVLLPFRCPLLMTVTTTSATMGSATMAMEDLLYHETLGTAQSTDDHHNSFRINCRSDHSRWISHFTKVHCALARVHISHFPFFKEIWTRSSKY